jgi:hypothetical protein
VQVRETLAVIYKKLTMKKTILILTFVFATFSCVHKDKKIIENKDSTIINLSHKYSDKKLNWYDELIINYIKKTDNELIKYSLKDTANTIEWLLDRVDITDSAKYLIFNIGQEVVDEGNTNMRFVTVCWVYIDSLTRKLYEYDLPNDRLIEWKK